MAPLGFKQPDRVKPYYAQACNSKFGSKLPFISIEVRFWKTRSKKYKNAAFLCSLIPCHECSNDCNYYKISTNDDYYIYYNIIKELHMIIFDWKYVEYYVNGEICFSDEYYLFLYHTPPIDRKELIPKIASEELRDFNNKWKNEKQLYHIVKDLLKSESVISQYRAEWLENLVIDVYIAEYRIAIEYQGIQHYKPLKHWGGEEEFIKRRKNDIRKKALCDANGVNLIYFTYEENITEELVISRLSQYIDI